MKPHDAVNETKLDSFIRTLRFRKIKSDLKKCEVICDLGCGKNAFFFAFFRKIILLIPLIYLLPFILPSYGVYAVVLAEPISDLMTTILNGIYFKHFVKKTLA